MIVNGNNEVYDTIFAIDNYKRAYIRCRLRNGYVQNVEIVDSKIKTQFNKKSRVLAGLIKKIARNEFTSTEEYVLLTKACALIESDILFLINKCHGVKKFSRKNQFNKFYFENKFMFDTFAGKTLLALLIENNLGFIIIAIMVVLSAIPIAIALWIDISRVFGLILWLVEVVLALIGVLYVLKRWEVISSTFRARKIRNKYIYLNSKVTKNIDNFILDMIKSTTKTR